MNAAVIREQATRIDAVAGNLRSVQVAIDQIVAGLGAQWSGADLNRFQGWWRDQHKPQLAAICDSIAGLAQSARNNADEQDQASETGSAGVGTGPGVGAGPAPSPTVGAVGVTGERTWQSVQEKYNAWATGRFAAGGESHYQCTGWANFRWQELGYDGIVGGHGGAMASNAGPTTADPSLHAMASYRSGNYGHVMIVEEMSADGSRIRVSEMNVDSNYAVGTPQEYRDTNWITRGADGVFRSSGGQPIEFAAFPG